MSEIDDLEFFAGLSSQSRSRLRRQASLLELLKGGIVYLPGDPGNTIYVLAEGRVKISKLSVAGKELTLAIHEPGELFGELTLMDDHPRRTMATAMLPSRVWSIPKYEFQRLVLSSPAFALRIGAIIGQRRRELESRMEGLVFRDVPTRLARQLLQLARKYGVERDGSIEIEFKVSQLELANMIGATRETTSTALNELKRAGILETSHRNIVIRDLPTLREIEGKL